MVVVQRRAPPAQVARADSDTPPPPERGTPTAPDSLGPPVSRQAVFVPQTTPAFVLNPVNLNRRITQPERPSSREPFYGPQYEAPRDRIPTSVELVPRDGETGTRVRAGRVGGVLGGSVDVKF